MRTFVIGDIHGAHLALEQCLERSGFDRENDLLITLGDICDGWAYVYECVEILLTIKKRIDLVGNHDEWFCRWLRTGIHLDHWQQGGRGTKLSYVKNSGGNTDDWFLNLYPQDVPESHALFFAGQQLYYKDKKKRVFVHGGFDYELTLREQEISDRQAFYWDRMLLEHALLAHNTKQPLKFREKVSEVFVGHTAVNYLLSHIENGIITKVPELHSPLKLDCVWDLDTGAGWYGKLTIMDVDTHEYWQSDNVNELYPGEKARG